MWEENDLTPKNPHIELIHDVIYAVQWPLRVFFHHPSGLWFCFIQRPSNVTRAALNYAMVPNENGANHAAAHLLLESIAPPELNRLDYYAANTFSTEGISIDVNQDCTSFNFTSIGNSGYTQLFSLMLERISETKYTEPDELERIEKLHPASCTGQIHLETLDDEGSLERAMMLARLREAFPDLPFGKAAAGGCTNPHSRDCTIDAYKSIHNYFMPSNAWVFVCGDVQGEDDMEIFDTLPIVSIPTAPHLQSGYLANQQVPDVSRHYTDPIVVSGISESTTEGVLQLSFLGKSPENTTFLNAADILLEYLCGSPCSPLNVALVHANSPVCSSIDAKIRVGPRCEVIFELRGVPLKRLNRSSFDRVFEVLRAEKWDLNVLQALIKNKAARYHNQMNGDFTEDAFERLKIFQLYASNFCDSVFLDRLLNPTLVLDELTLMSQVYWQKFAESLFTENAISIIGVPERNPIGSAAYFRQMEIERTHERRVAYRDEGEATFVQPGDFLFEPHPVEVAAPPLSPQHNVHVIDLKQFYWELSAKEKLLLLPAWFPTFRANFSTPPQFDVVMHHIETRYIKTIFFFDLRNIDFRLRHYLMIFTELVYFSPSTLTGELKSQPELMNLLRQEILHHSVGMGFNGKYKHLLHFCLEFDYEHFELMEKWMQALLCDTSFEVNAVRKIAADLAASAAALRNDAPSMCAVLMNSINIAQDSEGFFEECVLEQFHSELARGLEKSEECRKRVMEDLNSLRRQILNAPMSLHVIGNPRQIVGRVPATFKSLKRLRAAHESPPVSVNLDADVRAKRRWSAKYETHVIAVNSISPFGHLIERIPVKFELFGRQHASLVIFCAYFSMKGGLFSQHLVHAAVAQSVKLEYCAEKHTLTLSIFASQKLGEARKIVNDLLKHTVSNPVDEALFRLAQKSALAAHTEFFENINSTAFLSVENHLMKRMNADIIEFMRTILNARSKRAQDDVYDAFTSLLNESGVRTISCSTLQMHEVQNAFENILYPSRIVHHDHIPSIYEVV